MSINICRLCLSECKLSPIFVDSEQSETYSTVLALTTGLEIKPNDGYPQKICGDCTELVSSALTLRNQSHLSHAKLIKFDLHENSTHEENNPTITCKIKNENIGKNDDYEDCDDNNQLPEFKIEIQCDRLTEKQNGTEQIKYQNGGSSIQDGKDKKISRKKVRAMYMELVEGVFNPSGPVKCKVCKKSVSSWGCFRGHAKLHLQGKNVICEFCGKSFITKARLKRHCMSFHNMARELACKHCDYLALDKPQLAVHERRMHTGVRPFACDVCEVAFYSRACLVQHIESHRETCTVQCEQCPKKFKSARHLAHHRYKVHARKRRKRSETAGKAMSNRLAIEHVDVP